MSPQTILTEKQFELWKRRRTHGALFFVFVWGVIYWGGLMFLIMTSLFALAYVFRGVPPNYSFLLTLGVCLWLPGGLLWGIWTWILGERSFARTLHALAAAEAR